MFENVDIHTPTHIQTTEAYLYYKLTNKPKGSGELKMQRVKKKFVHSWDLKPQPFMLKATAQTLS